MSLPPTLIGEQKLNIESQQWARSCWKSNCINWKSTGVVHCTMGRNDVGSILKIHLEQQHLFVCYTTEGFWLPLRPNMLHWKSQSCYLKNWEHFSETTALEEQRVKCIQNRTLVWVWIIWIAWYLWDMVSTMLTSMIQKKMQKNHDASFTEHTVSPRPRIVRREVSVVGSLMHLNRKDKEKVSHTLVIKNCSFSLGLITELMRHYVIKCKFKTKKSRLALFSLALIQTRTKVLAAQCRQLYTGEFQVAQQLSCNQDRHETRSDTSKIHTLISQRRTLVLIEERQKLCMGPGKMLVSQVMS